MKPALAVIFLVLLALAGCRPGGRAEVASAEPPAQADSAKEDASLPPLKVDPECHALAAYKVALSARGEDLSAQAVLIETIDQRECIAEHNADVPFNPASVMKLATSFVALSTFKPDYRYRTDFLADGDVDRAARTLRGDLVVAGGWDPMFSAQNAEEVTRQLSAAGISTVTGGLRITGPFYYFATGYHLNLSPETSAAKLRSALARGGIRIHGKTEFGQKSGKLVVSHYSTQLSRILLYQNAHSSNAIAELVGDSLGGPRGVQAYLVKNLGLSDTDIFIGRTCGLEFNRITARAALKVLRGLIATLNLYSLKPEDIMPVAGVDSGTLKGRFTSDDVRGSVIAKTGTLNSYDRGVSTLVGIAHTKSAGTVLFAIFNSEGGVHGYRRLQDQFLEAFIAEHGGASDRLRLVDALAEQPRDEIVQGFSPNQNPPTDVLSE